LTIDTNGLDVIANADHRRQVLETVSLALGRRADGSLQPNLPGIDRTALIG
jgi:hypothetical protein